MYSSALQGIKIINTSINETIINNFQFPMLNKLLYERLEDIREHYLIAICAWLKMYIVK